jgi:Sulfotransferase domain
MIIWIASYPRAGNSLLRQILYYTMGQRSYSAGTAAIEIDPEYALPPPRDFESFYAEASGADTPFFVKTHSPPIDEQPALYVIRDGRAAITSFLRFERHVSPRSPSNSMLQLILGDHYYGGWSEHYRGWHDRGSAPILTLRYDELFRATDDVLARIADFIGYRGEIRGWDNPIVEYRRRYPDFVGEGRLEWTPPDEWDFICDAAFWSTHRDVMDEFRFDDGYRVPVPDGVSPKSVEILVELMRYWVNTRRELETVANEKEAVIQGLKSAIDELERERKLQAEAAAERLAVIEELHAVLPRTMAGSDSDESGSAPT